MQIQERVTAASILAIFFGGLLALIGLPASPPQPFPIAFYRAAGMIGLFLFLSGLGIRIRAHWARVLLVFALTVCSIAAIGAAALLFWKGMWRLCVVPVVIAGAFGGGMRFFTSTEVRDYFDGRAP